MNAESRLSRLLFVSPWPLLLFLAIPLLVILSVALHVRPFLLGSTTPLLINNICFALVAGCRLVRYLVVSRRSIRYGSALCRPRTSSVQPQPIGEARRLLSDSGYTFDTVGSYGEKRDLGYIGTTVLYGGLLLLLAIGTWDNLSHFSGVVMDGMGPASNLNKMETYRAINKGILAAAPGSLPRMQITNQYLPDATYPMGATAVSFITEDGKAQKTLLKPRVPVRYGAYDIYMAKLVFEPKILIQRSDTQKPLFDEIVTLNPLIQKRGAYSFYGPFEGYNLEGGVYYQPEKSSLLVVLSRNGKKVVADMVFQVDQKVEQDDFIISCEKMGQWSEIHVVHRRHKGLLAAAGLIVIIGLLLRIAFQPQRVWLEETPEGCRVWAVGRDAVKLLAID